jgi:hypothetical protein|nr:MAG TPA: hypothetical protein [Caudoviricetes sp.]
MANPNSLFPWLKYQDIQIADIALRTQFESYMSVGNYSQALRLLSDNQSQLQGKAWIGDSINTLVNGIITLESLYNDNVIKFLSDLSETLQSLVDNYRNVGTWIVGNEYKELNFVAYDNEMYMALQDVPVNTPITDTNYWLYVGLRGEQGVAGVNVRQQYDYSSGKAYNINDLVVYQGQIYVALKSNTNVLPTNSDTWLLYERVVKANIYVSNVAPTEELINGKIWFKTQSDPYTHLADTPIIGTFMMYQNGTWEEMYPDTIFDWVEDKDQYREVGFEIDTIIEFSDIQAVDIRDSRITNDAIVMVLPQYNITVEQWKDYNHIAEVRVANGVIGIFSDETFNAVNPSTNIPIRILVR